MTQNSWKREIRKLMRQFLIPKAIINQIIYETEQESKDTDSYDILYERAWRKAKCFM